MNENLPKNAKRVFKGVIFDVYQWEQEMFDGTTATFERIIRPSSTQIIVINSDKKITLLKEEQPDVGSFIGFVGGRVERNETPEENAKKELLEELGMASENITLWKTIKYEGKVQGGINYFIVKDAKKVAEQNLENGEKIEPYYVTFEEFLEEVEKPQFRNKEFREFLFRARHTPGEIDKIKKLFFE